MNTHAIFTVTGQDEPTQLTPGDFIGRSNKATMILSDPRISEAHAMISLRGQSLKLLALRGRFRHKGTVCTDVELKANQAIELAKGLWLNCLEIALPPHIPALRINHLPPVVLTNTISIFLHTDPYIKQGVHPQADAIIWSSGESWHLTFQDSSPQPVAIGNQWIHDDHTIQIIDIIERNSSQFLTRSQIKQPLLFKVIEQRVHIQNAVDPPIIISGIPGKILAALLQAQHATHWTTIASVVWLNDKASTEVLRARLDMGLRRLRQQMSSLFHTEETLITFDGTGVLSIHLSKQDNIICL